MDFVVYLPFDIVFIANEVLVDAIGYCAALVFVLVYCPTLTSSSCVTHTNWEKTSTILFTPLQILQNDILLRDIDPKVVAPYLRQLELARPARIKDLAIHLPTAWKNVRTL
jgi:hypothetical protein